MTACDNPLKFIQNVLVSLKMYSKTYSGQRSNMQVIVVH